MTDLTFVRHEILSLKDHPDFDEKWVQERIAENPEMLGLGEDVVLKDKERIQPGAGRLDLLLQDTESTRRYEVELQLGATDEPHIVRTLEYWDIERKRYPQYDHCAVIVAEDITSRFLNVINLFNGSIPLVAIQMNAIKVDSKVALVFTTVLDELSRGTEEDDEAAAPADRDYWETRGTRETVKLADDLLELVQDFSPGLELNFTKAYIGLTKNGQSNNFVSFCPQKRNVRLDVHLPNAQETSKLLEDAGLDVIGYDSRWRKYKIRVTKEDVSAQKDVLVKLMKMAKEERER